MGSYSYSTHQNPNDIQTIREAMNRPMLSKEREQELTIAWKENKDEAALHELITAFGRLVVAQASKFRHYGLPLSDIMQEGHIGLLEAANRFEPSKEFRFATYATWWIKSCMQDYVLRNWSIVRTGTTAAQKSLFFNLRRLRAKIESANEQEGLNDQDRAKIADELHVRVVDVENMEKRLFGGDSSLNQTMSDDDNSGEWLDRLSDERATPEENYIQQNSAETRSLWLNNALKTLNDREQTIIHDRHLKDNGDTLENLGNKLGISKERVRQIEQRAMEKLKLNLSKGDVTLSDIMIDGMN